MMYSTPFLLRVLGLLWLVLGLLGLLSVSALLKAQLPRSPSVVVSRGLVPLGWSIWPKAFLFAPQAKKILLFAFAKQDPTCLLVVVHCKVVSTLDKRNTKSHLTKLKKVCWPSSTTRGESTISPRGRRDLKESKQLSIHRRFFGISVVCCVLRLYFN